MCSCVSLSPSDKPTQQSPKVDNQERESASKDKSAAKKQKVNNTAKLDVMRRFENVEDRMSPAQNRDTNHIEKVH